MRREKLLQNVLSLFLAAAVVTGVLSWKNRGALPEPEEIDDALFSEPLQEMIDVEPYDFNYRGSKYIIEPVAEYQLRGLIVTHNDISEFTDIYHDENSVDIKDICVVWGKNLESNIYQRMNYWSEPWTCFFQTDSNEDFRDFNGDQLSNTHMLSELQNVRETILGMRIGDQIELSGILVNYYPQGQPERSRASSTVRTDSGNGACEVMMVDDALILKRGTPEWYQAFDVSKFLVFALLGLKLLVFIVGAYVS